jgi:hypothetical protein
LARHSLFSKGNPLDAISHWLIENRYFKNRNPKLQASETQKFTAIDHAVQCKHRPEFSIEILQNYVADRNDLYII